MCHFLICKMEDGARAANVFSLFNRFLVIKVAERVQQIAQQKCSGCANQFVLDQLHPCMRISTEEKVFMFLPQAKLDALTRYDKLYELFTKTTYILDDVACREAGEHFIELMQPNDILDRRFINEDSVLEYEFDLSWLNDEQNSILPPIAPLETTTVKKRTRKRKSKEADN